MIHTKSHRGSIQFTFRLLPLRISDNIFASTKASKKATPCGFALVFHSRARGSRLILPSPPGINRAACSIPDRLGPRICCCFRVAVRWPCGRCASTYRGRCLKLFHCRCISRGINHRFRYTFHSWWVWNQPSIESRTTTRGWGWGNSIWTPCSPEDS